MTDLKPGDDEVRFNARYPVGTPVRYWPGVRRGEGRESVTRTPAWLVGGHTPCVSVEGYPGGIALTHIEVLERAEVARSFTAGTPEED